jgi:cysteine desulfurase
MDHVLNLPSPGRDSAAPLVATKDLIAVSNGSACTSSSYAPSHVLKAAGMSDGEANGCLRISWCHLAPDVDCGSVAKTIKGLL